MAQKILLDTDIGDDVDDALALGFLCASSEFELCGISTVFGNVEARSRQARTILKLAGGHYEGISVAAGCGAALASRPVPNHGVDEYLNHAEPNQDSACLPDNELPPLDARHGVQLLIDTIEQGNGDIIPVAIGPLTNIAVALTMEWRIAAKIPKLVVMAGEFQQNRVEYNVHCDPEAVALVFNSGIPIEVIPWSAGRAATLNESELERLKQPAHPLVRNLCKAIDIWMRQAKRLPSLYDPLTLISLLHPEMLQWRQGKVAVELRGDSTYGYATFVEDDWGPHRVAWGVDSEAVIELFLSRLESLSA